MSVITTANSEMGCFDISASSWQNYFFIHIFKLYLRFHFLKGDVLLTFEQYKNFYKGIVFDPQPLVCLQEN